MKALARTALFGLLFLVSHEAQAEVVGKVSTDWVGNDIVVESIQDPKVQGVTCHLSFFERSLIDRLGPGIRLSETRKGAFWVLSLLDGEVIAADHYDAP